MFTLLKHKAAKIHCRAVAAQIMSTIELSRRQNNVSTLDTKTISIEPRKVFKKKNSYLDWTSGRMIPASTWSWMASSMPFSKNHYHTATEGSHRPQKVKAHEMGSSRSLLSSTSFNLLQHHGHCWGGKAISSLGGYCQQHDVLNIAAGQWHQWTWELKHKQVVSC